MKRKADSDLRGTVNNLKIVFTEAKYFSTLGARHLVDVL